MLNQFSRTQLVLGGEAMQVLARSRIAVFGIGGVGGYTVEALARSGVGALDLIDDDRVCLTNVNRQILATRETVGKCKVDAAEARIRTINPNCQVTTYKTFFLPGEESQFDFTQYDYVIDAIDTVSGKMGLVLAAKQASVPIISAMGAGNKVDPTAFRVADIYETSVCPLARVMRRLCRKNGVEHLKVVYSRELPIRPVEDAAISCRNARMSLISSSGASTGISSGASSSPPLVKESTGCVTQSACAASSCAIPVSLQSSVKVGSLPYCC